MDELDIKEVLKMFFEKKVLIILVTILCMVLGGVYSIYILKPEYKSSTTLVITQGNENATATGQGVTVDSATKDVTLSQKLVTTYSELVKSNIVLRQVILNLVTLNLSEEDLKENITVKEVDDTEIIQISVVNENPENAAIIANEIAGVFTEKVNEMYKLNNVYTLDIAEVSDTPYNINHVKFIGISAVIGIMISCGYVFLRNLFDNTTKNKDDIEKIVGVPVLVSLQKYDYKKKKGGAKL